MRRRRALGTVVVAALVLGISAACSDDGGDEGADDGGGGAGAPAAVEDLAVLDGLRAASEAPFATFATAHGAVGGVAGAFPVGEGGVAGFLAEHAGLFGLDQPGIGLAAVADEPAPGEEGARVLRYRQTYRGVPVAAGDVVVSVDVADGGQLVVRSVTGGGLPPFAMEVRPELPPDDAVAAAIAAAGGGSARTTPELLIVEREPEDADVALDGERTFALAWRVLVAAPSGGLAVTVEAGTTDGTVLRVAPTGAAATPDDLDVWNTHGTPQDEFVGDAFCTEEGDLYATEDGRVAGVPYDRTSDEGWQSLLQVYDYFLAEYGLDSYDGDGDTLQLRANVIMETPGNSAFWESWCEAIHINEDGTDVETVAHEFGHGIVDDRTGEPDRTTSFVAINESFADVLATGIEEDWVVIRDLSGRRTYEQDWVPYGPEHRNSLVPSSAWWLVAHGDGEHVLGLGGPRTRQLVLSTLTRMPDDIHVLDLGKIAWVTALLGGYSADEQCTVARAWREVMGDVARLPNCRYRDADGDGTPDLIDDCDDRQGPDTDHDGRSDPCDDDDDGDGLLDDRDLCPLVPDPTNADLDGDGIGDACDPDIDGDGFPNDDDSCPHVPNADQRIGGPGGIRSSLADQDFDGIDDACDPLIDTDGDGIANGEDNCTWDWNPDQADTNGDGIGDACEIDTDGDGIPDLEDVCSLVADPDQANSDGDLLGDACDPCPAGEDQVIASLPPHDPDGPGGLPPIGGPRTVLNDEDGDGIPDGCDDGPIIRRIGPRELGPVGPRLAFGDGGSAGGGSGGRGFDLPPPCGPGDDTGGDQPADGATVRARVVVTDLAEGARAGILGPDGRVLDAPPADDDGSFTLEADVVPGTGLLLVITGGGQQPTTADRHVMATAEVQYAPCADPGDDPHPPAPTFIPVPEADREVPTTDPGRAPATAPEDAAVDTTTGEGGDGGSGGTGGSGPTIGTVGTVPPLGTVPRPGLATTTTRPPIGASTVPCIQALPPLGQTTTTRPPGTPCTTTTTIGVGTIPPIGTVPSPPILGTTTTRPRIGTRPTIGTG